MQLLQLTSSQLSLHHTTRQPYVTETATVWLLLLLQGVLRGPMLTFFASASDFTRRLTSVEANAKFARLDAGGLAGTAWCSTSCACTHSVA
jgi:MoxR-like ATPase